VPEEEDGDELLDDIRMDASVDSCGSAMPSCACFVASAETINFFRVF